MSSRRRRSIGKVDMLPDEHRTAVQEMLLSNRVSYREICEYLAENGHELSQMAISNYARKYLDQMQMVVIAQENAKMMSELIERDPQLDYMGALLLLSSQQMQGALTNIPEEKWNEMDPKDLVHLIASLTQAAARKSRIDTQNQTEYERGMEAIKETVFTAMAKEEPELYSKVSTFLNRQKKRAGEE